MAGVLSMNAEKVQRSDVSGVVRCWNGSRRDIEVDLIDRKRSFSKFGQCRRRQNQPNGSEPTS
jgi:hypothetical protein